MLSVPFALPCFFFPVKLAFRTRFILNDSLHVGQLQHALVEGTHKGYICIKQSLQNTCVYGRSYKRNQVSNVHSAKKKSWNNLVKELTIASCTSLEHIPQTSERSTRPKCIEAWGILQILWLGKWSSHFFFW